MLNFKFESFKYRGNIDLHPYFLFTVFSKSKQKDFFISKANELRKKFCVNLSQNYLNRAYLIRNTFLKRFICREFF